MKKRLSAIVAAMWAVLMFSGCFDRVGLSQRVMVTGVGIDVTEAGDYRLTFAYYGSSPETKDGTVSSVTAPTIAQAISDGSVLLGKQLFLGNSELLLFSRRALEKKGPKAAKFFYQSYQISPRTAVAAAENAEELLIAAKGCSRHFINILKDGVQAGKLSMCELKDLAQVSQREELAAVVPLLLTPEASEQKRGELTVLTDEALMESLLGASKNAGSPEKRDGSSSPQTITPSREQTSSPNEDAKQQEIFLCVPTGGVIVHQAGIGELNFKGMEGLAVLKKTAKAVIYTTDGLSALGKNFKTKVSLEETGDLPVFRFVVTLEGTAVEGTSLREENSDFVQEFIEVTVKEQVQMCVRETLRQGWDVLNLYDTIGKKQNISKERWQDTLKSAGYAVQAEVKMTQRS